MPGVCKGWPMVGFPAGRRVPVARRITRAFSLEGGGKKRPRQWGEGWGALVRI